MNQKDDDFSYDSIAANYADNVDTAPYNALYERPAMLSMLPALDGVRILDAGCGSGWYAEQLANRGAIVDGVDGSASMVARARERFSRLPGDLREHVTFHVADLGGPLPFDAGRFAGVVSPLVLHYLRDWGPALGEIHRVLEPGGWLLLSTHHPAADAALFRTSNYFATELVVDHWDWVGEVRFYRRSLTAIMSSLRDSGFQIDQVVEPLPTDAFRVAKPESYEQLMRQPEFLIVKALRA